MLIDVLDAFLFLIYEIHFEFQMSIKTACPHTSVRYSLCEAASVSKGGQRSIYLPAQTIVTFCLPHLELAK